MGLVTDLAAVAGVVPRRHGSLALFSAQEAVRLVELADEGGFRVLGIEGFRLVEGFVVPDMDSVLDLSDVGASADSVVDAVSFLEAQVDESLVFDLVLND